MPFKQAEPRALPDTFSAPRFATYLAAKDGNKVEAPEPYRWNLDVSSAFFAPLQVCEVGIRNAVADAIERTYGADWPYRQSFEMALPDPPRSYNPRADLLRHKSRPTKGKVIAELKFIFWQHMFTERHDKRRFRIARCLGTMKWLFGLHRARYFRPARTHARLAMAAIGQTLLKAANKIALPREPW